MSLVEYHYSHTDDGGILDVIMKVNMLPTRKADNQLFIGSYSKLLRLTWVMTRLSKASYYLG